MAYEKQSWNCGDTITADKLNHMEDGIANADCGYSCSEEWVTLTDESVTTVREEGNASAEALLTYSSEINAETIKVTFDGVEYTCQYDDGGYGARYNYETDSTDWSTYPFQIFWDGDGNYFTTETAGTYQVKIEAVGEVVETSECFEKAVKSASEPLAVRVTGDNTTSQLDKTWQEINDAFPHVYAIPLDGNAKLLISKVYFDGHIYCVDTNERSFGTASTNGYPFWTDK